MEVIGQAGVEENELNETNETKGRKTLTLSKTIRGLWPTATPT